MSLVVVEDYPDYLEGPCVPVLQKDGGKRPIQPYNKLMRAGTKNGAAHGERWNEPDMPRFIAIPVAQGDAFYVERGEFSVLIDGGRRPGDIRSMFQEFTKRDGVNVIVCTHNDADHAHGILGLLKAGLKCGEVWLPGRWLSALPDLLRPFVEVFAELADNVAETGSWSNMENLQSSVAPIEAYAERMYPPIAAAPGTEDGLFVAEGGWPESYLQMLERAEPCGLLPRWPESWDPVGRRCLWWHGYYQWLGPAGIRLLWSAIKAKVDP